MSNKYYTPEIEEFHVGFEYEFHGMTTGGLDIVDFSKDPIEIKTISKPNKKIWSKESIYRDDCALYNRSFKSLEGLIKTKQIRVKYLDKEDIESLKFKQNLHEHKLVKFPVFEKECKYGILKLYFATEIKDIRISIINSNRSETNIFIGECKNKSELIKLLKQLNINE